MSEFAALALLLPIGLYGALAYFRSGPRGGAIGRAVRASDWYSWRIAVEDKERELAELRASEPKLYDKARGGAA